MTSGASDPTVVSNRVADFPTPPQASPIRVYVASRWASGPTLVKDIVDLLEAAGFACTQRWWTEEPAATASGWAAVADRDLRGVATADVVLVLATQGREGMGMWVEMGYALALGKPVLLWAPPEHAAFLEPNRPGATSPFVYAPGVRRWVCPESVLVDRGGLATVIRGMVSR